MFTHEKHLLPLSCPSVCQFVSITLAPTWQLYVKFDSGDLYEYMSRHTSFGYSQVLCVKTKVFDIKSP